jgi:hypothetical protein
MAARNAAAATPGDQFYGGAREPSLHVVAIVMHDGVELGQRRPELVGALAKGRSQQKRLVRRLRQLSPRPSAACA